MEILRTKSKTTGSQELADSVELISREHLLIFKLKNGSSDTADIHMITENSDIAFIRKHSSLK